MFFKIVNATILSCTIDYVQYYESQGAPLAWETLESTANSIRTCWTASIKSYAFISLILKQSTLWISSSRESSHNSNKLFFVFTQFHKNNIASFQLLRKGCSALHLLLSYCHTNVTSHYKVLHHIRYSEGIPIFLLRCWARSLWHSAKAI